MATIPNSELVRASYLVRTNRLIAYWLAGLSAVFAAGVCIYYRMFTGFSPWDDDGYVMISIRSLLNGHRLYDDVYSQYGPFYYLVHWTVYSVLGQPVSHDTQRLMGVALWLFAATLWARTVYMLTHSPVWSGFGFFLGVRLLEFFPLSAGHPEEICMALLAAIAVLACGIRPVGARRNVAALACLVAALALTKVNIGLYVAFAIGLVLLKASAPTSPQRFAQISLGLAGVVLPAALMSPLWEFVWARGYAFVATASIGAAILVARTAGPSLYMTGRIWWSAVLSFISCAVLVILPFCINGTTLTALLRMTVLQHAGFARNWYYGPPIDFKALLWTLASFALAFAYVRRRGVRFNDLVTGEVPTPTAMATPESVAPIPALRSSGWVGLGLLGLKTVVGLTCLFALTRRTIDADIFKYCVPFAWLVLVQPDDEAAHQTRGGRIALCFLAVFVYLYAFPVAGSQLPFASVPAGIVAIVLLRDATLGIANSLPPAWLPLKNLRIGPALGFTLLAALFSRELRDGYLTYRNSVSLGMPGATHIRVEPQVAATYRWITRNVDSCSALYSMPGLFSLYFWTAQKSPTELTMSNWVGLLNAAQQRAVVRDLSRYQGICIVYSPALVEFWRRGQDLSRSPLAQYIHSEFVAVAESDGYSIMKRRTATPFR